MKSSTRTRSPSIFCPLGIVTVTMTGVAPTSGYAHPGPDPKGTTTEERFIKGFVAKPYRPEDLLEAVRNALKRD